MARRLAPGLLLALVGFAWPGSASAGECTYTVKDRDTLSRIAHRNDVSQSELKRLNPSLAKPPHMIHLGQEIKVCSGKRKPKKSSKRGRPCAGGGRIMIHEVKKGDTLEDIADDYGVTKKKVLASNASLAHNPNMLRIGKKLEICAGGRVRVKKSKLCGNRTPLHTHKVLPGENVGSIAGRYGVRRTDLLKLNGSLKNANMLRVGQKLRVCPQIAPRSRQRKTHIVKPGETFGSIAKKYKLTRRELERFQRGKLKNTNSLRTGQKLVVYADGGVEPGFAGYDPNRGVLKNGTQLLPGPNHHVKWEAASWGTRHTVQAITDAVRNYKNRMPGGPKVHVGDLSKRAGGSFPPHISHQHGRDADIGYVLKGAQAKETRFRRATKKNLDVARTWRLIKALIDTNEVSHIFMDYRVQKLIYEYATEKRGLSEDGADELFQYPRGKGRDHGIIRHWKGHTNHFHVRFRR